MSVINGNGRHFNGGECNKPAAVEGITVVSVINGGGRYINGGECNKRWWAVY